MSEIQSVSFSEQIPPSVVDEQDQPPDRETPTSNVCLTTTTCINCKRVFKTARGLNQHVRLRKCQQLSSSEDSIREVDPSVLADSATADDTSVWGGLSMDDLNQTVSAIYEECVYWRRNLFLLPSGKAGKQFIEECTRLINIWNNDSPLKPIALKALMIMPSLLLQKVSKNSKARDHSEQLRKRMDLWKSGDFDTLVREVRYIQSKLRSFTNVDTIEQLARKFNDLMLAGKINPALRLLSDSKCSGILPINDETKQLLRDKHPPADEKHDDLLLEGPELRFDEYAYESITRSLIRKIAREVQGA